MSKHTPGPWMVGYNDGSGRGYSADGSFDSIYVTHNGENAVATMFNGSHADARLIAAAPDLLESLIQVVTLLDHPDCPYRNSIEIARRAIKKAEGV